MGWWREGLHQSHSNMILGWGSGQGLEVRGSLWVNNLNALVQLADKRTRCNNEHPTLVVVV